MKKQFKKIISIMGHIQGIFNILRIVIYRFFKKESKYFYPSFFIGGIFITFLIFELETLKEISLWDFILYATIAYLVIKVVESIMVELNESKSLVGFFKYIYILFFTYLTIIYSYELTSYITVKLKVQPQLFNQTIYYLSVLKAIQFTIFMFMVPVLIALFFIIFDFVFLQYKPLWKYLYVISKVVTIIIFLAYSNKLSISENYTFGKSDEFWIAKHGFTDIVLCEGETYNDNITYANFKAKKIIENEYLILDIRSKKYHFYDDYSMEEQPYNYYKITCDDINSIKPSFHKIINLSSKIFNNIINKVNVVFPNYN